MASKQRNLIWRMIAAEGDNPTIKVEVWNEPTSEDYYASYTELTLISGDASFTYRMDDHAVEEMIAHLKQALDYSRRI